jgi:site-specific DNA-methyltransferase (adenine-specific)
VKLLQLIYKKLKDIKQYDNNPRKNDEAVKYVAESIKEFGFKVPIVIDKEGVIVAGHTRWKAAKSLNIKEVPCIIADDLSDDQIKAYRLADNKVAEFAEWDFNILNLELDELLAFDMSTFGFDIDEVVDEYGTDFDLPDGDKSELEQITFTLHKEQAEFIKYAIGQIDEYSETFGNTNKNGNAIYELVKQWAELKK